MSVIILIGIDPFAQPDIDFIQRYDSIDSAYEYVKDWLDGQLEKQKKFICGLKGNKEQHIEKYITLLKNENYIHFYGEYKTESDEPYEYKWMVYNL
jgi:hypothetical protein